jgi:ATP adenylyltransferase/5',5'''-P-1,P-4-tetraphosphate phosphorylase II
MIKSEVGSYLEGVGFGKFTPDNEDALTLANLHSLTKRRSKCQLLRKISVISEAQLLVKQGFSSQRSLLTHHPLYC